jgi:NAD(P)-dependent dehydrogenase (short-subunit alcohol dehydrogenase family)
LLEEWFVKLKGLVAVITGSGSGIGRASALEFAKEGARVVVADINLNAALETVRLILQRGEDAVAVETDVAEPDSVRGLVAATLSAFSTVDVLFNNAGIAVCKTIEEMTIDEWNRQIAVNLGGIFLCSKYFMPYLRKMRGTIINMSSVNSFFVEPMLAAYCATKSAITALTKAMAIDHGNEGIRVNCIRPGYVDSGGAQVYFDTQADPAAARAAAGKLHALGRIGQPEEIARVAVFLASQDASFITGAAVDVTAGFGMGIAASG